MENSSSSTSLHNLETEVCKILLNFKKIICQFDSNLHWVGAKPKSPRHLRFNPNCLCHIRSEKRESLNSKKRTREKMLEKIEKLFHNKKQLTEVLGNVKIHHNKLMVQNLELKKMKKQLQLPWLENQGQPQHDDVAKYQPSDIDSCQQVSIKPCLGFDLNKLPPSDDEMEWSPPLDQSELICDL